MTGNLVDGLLAQMNRCRELLKVYQDMGPVGAFGAALIRCQIAESERALGTGDVVDIIAAYKSLETIE